MRPGEGTLEVRADGARLIATLRGEIDLATVPAIESRLREEMGDNPRELVVDLGPVTFLDSTGTSMLFRLATEAATQRRALTVVAPPGGPARRLLGLVSFAEAAPVVDELP